jgi:hypothetical protein
MNSSEIIHWIMPLCFLSIVITGCGNGGDEQEVPRPQSACGIPPATAFASPTVVTAVNSVGYDASPEVTNGQLSLYLHSDRLGGYGSFDIYVSDRADPTDEWGTPENLGSNINSDSDDRAPTVSSDGLTLIFASDRGGDLDLYTSTRSSVNDAWSPATNMGTTINSTDIDSGPSLSEDGLTLVFFSGRPGGTGLHDLYMSTRASSMDAWSAPTDLGATVNSDVLDVAPDISCDGLRIYFHSNRNGNLDIWLTERTSLTAPWTTPVIIPTPVSTDENELTPSISADETTLYFSRYSPGGDAPEIWQVTR